MEKAGYDFQNPTTLRKVVEAKPHGLNETQRKIQEQGGSIGVSKVGLGFTPSQPIRISGRRKGKQSVVQHISAKALDESDDEDAQRNLKSSVCDRLQSPSIEKSPSVFTRIRERRSRKVSVFNIIKDGLRPKASVFTRIQSTDNPSDSSLQQEKS